MNVRSFSLNFSNAFLSSLISLIFRKSFFSCIFHAKLCWKSASEWNNGLSLANSSISSFLTTSLLIFLISPSVVKSNYLLARLHNILRWFDCFLFFSFTVIWQKVLLLFYIRLLNSIKSLICLNNLFCSFKSLFVCATSCLVLTCCRNVAISISIPPFAVLLQDC